MAPYLETYLSFGIKINLVFADNYQESLDKEINLPNVIFSIGSIQDYLYAIKELLKRKFPNDFIQDVYFSCEKKYIYIKIQDIYNINADVVCAEDSDQRILYKEFDLEKLIEQKNYLYHSKNIETKLEDLNIFFNCHDLIVIKNMKYNFYNGGTYN